MPALLCTSSSNAPLALYLSTFCCCLCPSLAHHFTLFTLSLAGSWCGEFFWFFSFAMVNFPFVPNQKKRSTLSNIGKRCVKPFKNRSVYLCGHPNTSIGSRYLDVYTNRLMSFYTIVPMSFGAWSNHRVFIFLSWLYFLMNKILTLCKECKHLPSLSRGSCRLSYFLTPILSKTHLPSPWPTYCR